MDLTSSQVSDSAKRPRQGVTHLSVQSSVSLQHLPVDTALEAGNLPPALLGRLSFATQKLGEIVRAAARAADGSKTDTGTESLFTPGAQAYSFQIST